MDNVVPFPVERSAARLGRYRLIANLGQGGMGTIHLAVAGGIGGFRKLFVLKELKAELAHNEEFLRLFLREARLAARLNHPNVVQTMEADRDQDRYFLAMEFLDGQPFSAILRRAPQAPSIPLALRLSVVCHALAGLHHAHELRDYDGRPLEVVHRDVSPTNIFVTYDGQVKVLDFGIARAGDVEGTEPRSFKGKIGYAAPEQLRMRPGDRRIDVFAAGIVLWEAIALRQLVRGKPSPQVFEARLFGTEPRIGQLLPDLDPELGRICDRAMAVDVDERYPSAEALRQDLSDYLGERNLLCDAASIAPLMRVRFAEERAVIHRVIEEQLRNEEDITHSFITTRDPLWLSTGSEAERGSGAPRAGEVVSAQAAVSGRPPRAGLKTWVLGACVLAAGAGAVRLYHDPPRQLPAAPPRETEAPPASPASRAPIPRAAPIVQPARIVNEPGEPQPDPPATTNTPSNRAPVRPLAPAARPGYREATSASSRPGDASARDAGPSPARAEPASAVREERAPERLDVDLRRLAPSSRRPLDVDNPFR